MQIFPVLGHIPRHIPRRIRAKRVVLAALGLGLLVGGCSTADLASRTKLIRDRLFPAAWDDTDRGAQWTQTVIRSLTNENRALLAVPLEDVAAYCPTYKTDAQKLGFWVGVLSKLADWESGHRETVAGGGGRYIGLFQIAPGTAKAAGCSATTAEGLKDGNANIECALKIMTRHVVNDQAMIGSSGNWAGLARDWGPLRQADKQAELAAFTRSLPACGGKG